MKSADHLQKIADKMLPGEGVEVQLLTRREPVADGNENILGDDGEPLLHDVQFVRIKLGRGVSTGFDLVRGKGVRIDKRTPLTDEEIVAEFKTQLGHFVKEHAERQLRAEVGHEEYEKLILARRKKHLAEAAAASRQKTEEIRKAQEEIDSKTEPHSVLKVDHDALVKQAVAQGVMTKEEAEAKIAERQALLAAKQAREEKDK